MTETIAGNTNPLKQRQLTIRVGRGTLSFALVNEDGQDIEFEPYVVRSGVSMAANLREAFKTCDALLNAPPRVRLLIDSNVLMVPVELFAEADIETLHTHAFPPASEEEDRGRMVCYNVLPDLNCVAVFDMNRDLQLVLDDHFQSVRLISDVTPVWRHMHQRSFTGSRLKLYGYFHERRLEVFSFQQNRFRFCNSFDASRPQDGLYFLLYVWKQLNLNAKFDELHIMGDIPQQKWLVEQLHIYLQKVFVVNPSADFQQAPATEIKAMPYDLMTLFVKGR